MSKKKKSENNIPKTVAPPSRLHELLAPIANPPQRLESIPRDVCSVCRSINSFTVYASRNGIQYLVCKKCGRHAFRLPKKGEANG